MTAYRSILVVELLGGFGDVLLVLPAVHALAAAHPGAALRVLTYAPGDVLLAHDPAVAGTVAIARGEDPGRAVRRELAAHRPELAVTTTRHAGIPALLDAGAGRAITDLWRRPPPDERIDRRFLRLLAAEGVVGADAADVPLAVRLTAAERAAGEATLDAVLPRPTRRPGGGLPHRNSGPGPGPGPVVLVPDAGMAVKRWPADRWAELAAMLGSGSGSGSDIGTGAGHGTGDGARRPVLTVLAGPNAAPVPGTIGVPATDLRGLAAFFAAVGARGGTVVGADTGPTRLATAVGTRTVGLYGPTVAGRYGLDPRTGVSLQGLPGCTVRRPAAIAEQECWWTARCPLAADGDPACMADLAVDAVLVAITRT